MAKQLSAQTRDQVRALAGTAMTHLQAGHLAQAERACRAALAMAPGDVAVTHNLGVVVAAQGRHRDALRCFEAALAADRSLVCAHYNRAVALLQLGETGAASQAFGRAAALEPQHYQAHRALGFLFLAQGERGRALDHFARTYELRRGDDRTTIALASLTTATRHKLAHDAEQFLYLAERTRERTRFAQLARSYRAVARQLTDAVGTLDAAQIGALGEDYNAAIHLHAAPEVVGRAVAARDPAAATAQFDAGGATWIDDLLTPAALAGLRRFLLESTIWHDFSHIDGFVASYLEDGLACPLVLQIADELRSTFPGILGAHPLSQAWAFKGLRAQAAVDVHADDAAVSVNLWLTPSSANVKPERGGLVVCRTPPPDDWQIRDYDADRERIVTFLAQEAGNSLVVPYRENRAAVFRSRLFHHSDRPEFASGYDNHRINLTLLYGRRQSQ